MTFFSNIHSDEEDIYFEQTFQNKYTNYAGVNLVLAVFPATRKPSIINLNLSSKSKRLVYGRGVSA